MLIEDFHILNVFKNHRHHHLVFGCSELLPGKSGIIRPDGFSGVKYMIFSESYLEVLVIDYLYGVSKIKLPDTRFMVSFYQPLVNTGKKSVIIKFGPKKYEGNSPSPLYQKSYYYFPVFCINKNINAH